MLEAYLTVGAVALVVGLLLGTQALTIPALEPLVAWFSSSSDGRFSLSLRPPATDKKGDAKDADANAPRMSVPGLTVPGDTVLAVSAARAAFSAYAKVLVDELERIDVLEAVRRVPSSPSSHSISEFGQQQQRSSPPNSSGSGGRPRSVASRSSSASSRVRFAPSEIDAARAAQRTRRREELVESISDALGVYRGLLALCADADEPDPDVVVSIQTGAGSGEYRIDVRPASVPGTPTPEGGGGAEG
ncbi:uncharacterized protein LOC62_05G007138 [Vanrija pseudolonga]|uniref:Uncharacterized protein n=1 Tax=Vanrija pseudolonga TaxID=143232 RepID=A0AAF0YHD8_9TREE|nr:hypothetical protein LOC62_05G007138 [Vanrija pseudolonga]